MGWFSRGPRRVGFGTSKPIRPDPKPEKYRQPPPAPDIEPEFDRPHSADDYRKRSTGPWSDRENTDDRRPDTPAQIAAKRAEAMAAIARFKKKSPWLGSIAERMAGRAIDAAAARAQSEKTDITPKAKRSGCLFLTLFMLAFFGIWAFVVGVILFADG